MRHYLLRCSFCGRDNSEVAKLVAGPRRFLAGRVYICDRCAAETIRIMEAHSEGERPFTTAPSPWRRLLNALRSARRGNAGQSQCHAV
jgi:ATP-dependent protease Clp ATPase subunit